VVKERFNKSKNIYVVLSDTGTWFTRLIRLFTKAPFNHASIAFDSDLNEVYSFGRKRPNNPLSGGFVREDLRGELFKGATCAIYGCAVSERRYRRLRAAVLRFEREADSYKFNFLGLLGVLLNIGVDRKRAFFCSQFVASLFEQTGDPLIRKRSALTTPADLGRSDKVRLLYQGEMTPLVEARKLA